MLSMKTRYAMVALIYLAKKYNQGTVRAQEIATSENIPVRFLEGILLEIKKMGFISSRSGKNGGYFLIKPPKDIRLADLVRYFEGGVGLLYCVSEKLYQPCEFCKDEATCKIRRVFKDIRDYTYNTLNQTSLEMLANEN
jgi:Rrf2 family protein